MKRPHQSKLRALRLRRVRRITAGLTHHHAPTWSKDARLIASRLGEGTESYLVIVDRKGRVARVLEGPVDGVASFAPDGSLAYSRQVGATSEIWQLPLLSSLSSGSAAPRRLLGGDGRLYRDPAYSPDGRFLCYAADDGHAGVNLRLWLYDLAHEEHKVLVSELALELRGDGGNLQPPRIGHPAWSRNGDRIYFDAQCGDASAIYSVSPSTLQVERVTGLGYRRPAPLAPGLLLCERAEPGTQQSAESELVLIDHQQQHQPRPRHKQASQLEAPPHLLTPLGLSACEPAVVWRKHVALIAFAMSCRAAPDEPSRSNLHVGRLYGLPGSPVAESTGGKRGSTSEKAPPGEPAASESSSGTKPTPHHRRQPDDASVWLDRPLLSAAHLSEGLDEEPAAP